jgi:hypothetical protein
MDSYIFKLYISGKNFINSTPLYLEKERELEKHAEGLRETDNSVFSL